MRCISICTAEAFNLPGLSDALKENHTISREKDALFVELQNGSVFYFAYGCVVCWGLSYEEEREYLNKVVPFQENPLKQPVEDFISYSMGDQFKIVNDHILLANSDFLTMLTISHGLAQSIKLDVFERSVDQTVEHTRHIPEQMSKMGKVGLSRRQIRKKMGQLFMVRNSINLHSDILDKPELLWISPEMETLYTMTANYFELVPRVDVLNQRLGVIHELFEILNSELNHQQTSRLEWIIIILILIEVGIALLKDVFRWI